MKANSEVLSAIVLDARQTQGILTDHQMATVIDIAFQNPGQAGYTADLALNILAARMGCSSKGNRCDKYAQIVTHIMGEQHQIFSDAQRLVLYNIAHQCPELGGTAVYRARSIYALIDYQIFADNCPPRPQARMDNVDTCFGEVHFINPSLEHPSPQVNRAPLEWTICDYSPDTWTNMFGLSASDSLTYVGQTAAASGTGLEYIGQQLLVEDTLIKGQPYRVLLDIAKFSNSSPIGGSMGGVSLWLGDSLCTKTQLAGVVTTTDTFWRTFVVDFIPIQNFTHVVLSAYYLGVDNHGLVDNLRPYPCDTTTAPPADTFHIDPDHEYEAYLLGVEEIAISKFNIYPNPNTYGVLVVDWGLVLPSGKIVIVDALGRNVAHYTIEQQAMQQQINIEKLPSGFYTVLLQNENRIIARAKLIVAKQ